MTYEITDEFLDCVDRLLDSVMEMSQHADPMTASGVALVELKRFEAVRDNAVRVCDAMEDGFPEYGKDEEDEETTEECTNPVTMILLPYLMIRMVLDVILMLIDTLADGFDVLGPRFQGMVIGFFGAISLLIVAINLAIWG